MTLSVHAWVQAWIMRVRPQDAAPVPSPFPGILGGGQCDSLLDPWLTSP